MSCSRPRQTLLYHHILLVIILNQVQESIYSSIIFYFTCNDIVSSPTKSDIHFVGQNVDQSVTSSRIKSSVQYVHGNRKLIKLLDLLLFVFGYC